MYTLPARSTRWIFREGDIREFFKSEISPSTVFIWETETGGIRSSWMHRDEERFSCHEYVACVNNSHGWCCAYFAERGIENLRRICGGRIRPTCVFGTVKTQRVDLVCDVYMKDSLKLSTRANRGTECLAMPIFQGTGKTTFLRNDDNKDELFLPVPRTRVCYLGHRSSYSPYWTVSLALEMARTQSDFNHAHTKRQTPGCLFMSNTPRTAV